MPNPRSISTATICFAAITFALTGCGAETDVSDQPENSDAAQSIVPSPDLPKAGRAPDIAAPTVDDDAPVLTPSDRTVTAPVPSMTNSEPKPIRSVPANAPPVTSQTAEPAPEDDPHAGHSMQGIDDHDMEGMMQ